VDLGRAPLPGTRVIASSAMRRPFIRSLVGLVALVGVALAVALFPARVVTGCAAPVAPVLDVTPTSATLVAGQTVQLAVTRRFSGGPMEVVTDRVGYTTSSRSIVAVNERGLVTAGTEAGSAVVRVIDPLSDAVATTTFTVSFARIDSIEIVPAPAATLRPGERRAFFATAHLQNGQTRDVTAQVTWASSNDTVATVGKTTPDVGLVSAVGEGDVTISATDPQTNAQGRSIVFVRGDPAALRALVVTPNPGTVGVGANRAFGAMGIYGDGTSRDLTRVVAWSSNNESVATVDSAGVARGVAIGDATITASAPSIAPGLADAGAEAGTSEGGAPPAAIMVSGSAALRVQ
jgi:trimeric autotransporter adhesin